MEFGRPLWGLAEGIGADGVVPLSPSKFVFGQAGNEAGPEKGGGVGEYRRGFMGNGNTPCYSMKF